MKHEFLRDSIKMTEERDRTLREQNMVIKRRDQAIEKLKKQIRQYEENEKKYQKVLKSEDNKGWSYSYFASNLSIKGFLDALARLEIIRKRHDFHKVHDDACGEVVLEKNIQAYSDQ